MIITQLKSQGAKTLANLFKNPNDAYANGISLAGIKYLAIKADNQSIYGKKGAGGVVTVKTGHGKIKLVQKLVCI